MLDFLAGLGKGTISRHQCTYKFVCLYTVLSRHDLKWLVERLSTVQAKWYTIGVQLELPSGNLDAIQRDSVDTSSAFTKMLNQWLAGENPSVDVLSKALQTNIVAEARLGRDILLETCELSVT